MKTGEVKCLHCGETIQRPQWRINENEREGRKNYCNRSCKAKYEHENRGRGTAKYHIFRDVLRRTYCSHKSSHEKRGLNHNLTTRYLADLWSRQDGKCYYTGIPLKLREKQRDKRNLGIQQASIDRIDSNKEYIEGNVRFVCLPINLAKGANGDEYIFELIKAIKTNKNEWI